eukprot:1339265-Amphidinium_carterae.1
MITLDASSYRNLSQLSNSHWPLRGKVQRSGPEVEFIRKLLGTTVAKSELQDPTCCGRESGMVHEAKDISLKGTTGNNLATFANQNNFQKVVRNAIARHLNEAARRCAGDSEDATSCSQFKIAFDRGLLFRICERDVACVACGC